MKFVDADYVKERLCNRCEQLGDCLSKNWTDATLKERCFVCSVLDSATKIEVESGAKLIDIKELFECETCFHNKYNGCDTYCDHGESYRPAVSKFKTIEIH